MVPAVAHFIWFGRTFWWANALAIRSAAERGDFERVVLHHDQDLEPEPAFRALAGVRGFEARRLNPPDLFAALGDIADPLGRLFDELEKPNARANVVRAAILAGQGGVYLDIDTITVKSFTPLLAAFVLLWRRASGVAGGGPARPPPPKDPQKLGPHGGCGKPAGLRRTAGDGFAAWSRDTR